MHRLNTSVRSAACVALTLEPGNDQKKMAPLDHYIPQVHLKNFYSPILGERMYATRKSDLKSFTPDSKSVCRIMNGSTNPYLVESRALEEFLKSIEPKYNLALSRFREGKIDQEAVYVISGLVAYIVACSPTGVRLFSEPMKRLVETEAIMLEERGRLPLPPEEMDGKTLAQVFEAGDIEVQVEHKYPQAIGFRTLLKQTMSFGNFRWDVLLNSRKDSPFFTSDFPVAIEETRDWRVVNRLVPLAPDLAVRILPDLSLNIGTLDRNFSNFRYHMRQMSRAEAVDVNRKIVRSAEDLVFYRDDRPWVRKFIAKNRHYHIEEIGRRLQTEDGYLNISSTRVRKRSC